MINRLFLTLLFGFGVFFGFTQQEKDSITIPVDEKEMVYRRGFEKDLTEKYIGQEFDYSSQEGQAQNLVKRFLGWFFGWINKSFGINISPYILKILEYCIYVLMGGLIIYLFVRFFSGEKLSSVFTKQARAILDIDLSEEHIENIDLDGLIQSALGDGNYRLAVRYQYLRILKILSQKGIIDWHYEKTNSDYQNEIETKEVKSGFLDVSYLYDHIWYGEQEIDENKYRAIAIRFANLKSVLHN